MRKYRFRVPHPDTGKLYYFQFYETSGSVFPCPPFWNTDWAGDVEQFIGLHDKNGREIYEGDIVRFDVVATERGPGPLGLTGIVQDVPRYGWGIGGYGPAWIKNEEVIGNIHENPELLNEAV